jgi:hypothetical protein
MGWWMNRYLKFHHITKESLRLFSWLKEHKILYSVWTIDYNVKNTILTRWDVEEDIRQDAKTTTSRRIANTKRHYTIVVDNPEQFMYFFLTWGKYDENLSGRE